MKKKTILFEMNTLRHSLDAKTEKFMKKYPKGKNKVSI